MSSYSRLGYMALKAEVTENTAVTPDTFVPIMSEDIVTQWGDVPAVPIQANRAMNLRAIETAIEPPTGTVTVLLEPKTMGHFLKGVYGSVTSGQLMKMTSASGDWAVADTVTGGSSATTATVAAVSSELDYLLVTSPSGLFTDGETITNGSTGTGTLTQHDATVFGHEFTAPQNSLPTYTVEFGFDDKSYRYTGVRFNNITFNQTDNVMSAEITLTSRTNFLHTRVTAVIASGAGSKAIPVDQTTGVIAADTIKVFRPGTGFLDFSATGVKTHTIDSVTGQDTITVTNLEVSLAVGDLVMLAQQTVSLSIDREFAWIGGTSVVIDDDITVAITGTEACIEDFETTLENEIEARHCAVGTDVVDRFPSKNLLKGLTGNGSLTRVYQGDDFLDRLRNNTQTAIYILTEGKQIASTGQNFGFDLRMPDVQLQPFNANLSEDDLLNQEMEWTMYYSDDDGYSAKALLTNDITSY